MQLIGKLQDEEESQKKPTSIFVNMFNSALKLDIFTYSRSLWESIHCWCQTLEVIRGTAVEVTAYLPHCVYEAEVCIFITMLVVGTCVLMRRQDSLIHTELSLII